MRKNLLCLVVIAASSRSHAADRPYQFTYQFNQNGQPGLHTFILKWGSESANLQTIEVKVTGSDQILQTIAVPQAKVHLNWHDIAGKPGETKEKIFDFVDYNFDKFPDLRLLQNWPYRPGEKQYVIWLYNDKTNKYEVSEVLSTLPAPMPDAKTKLITSVKLTGFGGGEYEERTMAWDGATPIAHLILEQKITQTALDPTRLSFLREVRLRKNGELARACKFRIPGEGKPKLLWGKKTECEPFAVKGAPIMAQKKPAPEAVEAEHEQ